jgi:hypothetical protein
MQYTLRCAEYAAFSDGMARGCVRGCIVIGGNWRRDLFCLVGSLRLLPREMGFPGQ